MHSEVCFHKRVPIWTQNDPKILRSLQLSMLVFQEHWVSGVQEQQRIDSILRVLGTDPAVETGVP